MTTQKVILQDTRSKLFYDKGLGGFSQSDKSKATQLEDVVCVAWVKAHFQYPEFIVSLPLVDAEMPNPENAQSNQHINGSIRRIALPSGSWNSRSYIFGDWEIECYKYNQNKGASPYLKATRTNYVSMWTAYNKVTQEALRHQAGGIRQAEETIVRQEMKKHGI